MVITIEIFETKTRNKKTIRDLIFTTPENTIMYTGYFSFTEPFLMLVAAGPFTTSDSLLYEPLADLMKAVQNHKPDLLILV